MAAMRALQKHKMRMIRLIFWVYRQVLMPQLTARTLYDVNNPALNDVDLRDGLIGYINVINGNGFYGSGKTYYHYIDGKEMPEATSSNGTGYDRHFQLEANTDANSSEKWIWVEFFKISVNASRGTPWIDFDRSQLGVKEATGNNDGADVDKYLATANLAGTKLAWCGCFVNWSLENAGIKGVKEPAWALNWRKYGQKLNQPAYGSIGSRERKGGGHVGFVVASDADRPGWVIMLGGTRVMPSHTSLFQYRYCNSIIQLDLILYIRCLL